MEYPNYENLMKIAGCSDDEVVTFNVGKLKQSFLILSFWFFFQMSNFYWIGLDKSFKFDCMRMITSDSTQNEALAIYIPIMVLLPGKGGHILLNSFCCLLYSTIIPHAVEHIQ